MHTNVCFPFFRLVLCVTGGESEFEGNVRIKGLAGFIPHTPMVLIQEYSFITHHTDAKIHFAHLHHLTILYDQITINLHSISHEINISQRNTLKLIGQIIQDTAENMLNYIDMLPQALECQNHTPTRTKRSAEFINTGIFPAVGTALSWLTGTLDSSAAKYINQNTDNLNKLKNAQSHLSSAVNHTAEIASRNEVKISKMRNTLRDLSKILQANISELDKQLVTDEWISGLLTAAKEARRTANLETQMWTQAVQGTVFPGVLTGLFWRDIKAIISQQTRTFTNIRYIISRTAKVTIHACKSNIYVDFAIPQLSRERMTSYEVIPFLVEEGKQFAQLKEIPKRISWDDRKTYSFTSNEIERCKHLKTLSVCERPAKIENIHQSCLYRIANSLNIHTFCKLEITKYNTSIVHFGHYIKYNLFKNKRIALAKCPHKQIMQRELVKSGIITIPNKCWIRIDGITYQNTDLTKTGQSFENRPKVYTPYIGNNTHTYNYTKLLPFEKTIRTDTYMIQKNLQLAEAELGSFEYHKDHLVPVATGTMVTVVLIVLGLTIITLYVCGCPNCRGRPIPRRNSTN